MGERNRLGFFLFTEKTEMLSCSEPSLNCSMFVSVEEILVQSSAPITQTAPSAPTNHQNNQNNEAPPPAPPSTKQGKKQKSETNKGTLFSKNLLL